MNLNTKSVKIGCAGFVVICNDHVLLVSTHKGVWGFPKGKREGNEEHIICAFRELNEETSLVASQITPIDIDKFFLHEITDKGNPSVRLYLAITDSLIEPKIKDMEELADAKWVQVDEAYKLLIVKNRKQILLDSVEYLKKIL